MPAQPIFLPCKLELQVSVSALNVDYKNTGYAYHGDPNSLHHVGHYTFGLFGG